MRSAGGVFCFIVASVVTAVGAETWHTTRGETFTGKLTGVYGTIAVIAEKKASSVVSLDLLGDDELARVADFLATRPTAPTWKESNTKVAKAVKGRLQVLRDGKLVDFDPSTRRDPEFYLVYFGANWCPPCRAFSPTLVAAYDRLQKLALGRFEVVFISSDQSNSEMLTYMKHAAMPWPVLKFSQAGRAEPLERWAARGIPCLVAVTAEGDALFHSYRGEEYVGPNAVLQEFEALLRNLDERSPARRRSLHRLSVMQHLRSAAGANRPAAPYVISLDLGRYQTLELKEVTATLQLNEKGEVTEASFAPQLPTVLDFQLVKDASTWLFLPAVENGQPVRQKVQLPLKLRS